MTRTYSKSERSNLSNSENKRVIDAQKKKTSRGGGGNLNTVSDKKLERAVAAVLKKRDADGVDDKSVTFADVEDEVNGVDNNAGSVMSQHFSVLP